MRPLPRADSGRDQQPVVWNLITICQMYHPVCAIQAGGGDAKPPIRIDCAQARQLGVVSGHPTLQHLLGEGRAIIRLVRLIADDGQRAGKASFSQAFSTPKPRQRCADDDDPAACLHRVDGGLYELRSFFGGKSTHGFCPSNSSSWSTMIACTGQDAAARRTRRRCASSGLGSYMSASSPLSWRTSGARGTHCAYPWHRFKSTTIRISLPLLRLCACIRDSFFEWQNRSDPGPRA